MQSVDDPVLPNVYSENTASYILTSPWGKFKQTGLFDMYITLYFILWSLKSYLYIKKAALTLFTHALNSNICLYCNSGKNARKSRQRGLIGFSEYQMY